MLYIAQKLKDMTIQKLLGLLFEHIEKDEVFSFEVNWDFIIVEFIATDDRYEAGGSIIYLKEDLLQQYNKIF